MSEPCRDCNGLGWTPGPPEGSQPEACKSCKSEPILQGVLRAHDSYVRRRPKKGTNAAAWFYSRGFHR